MSEDRGMKQYTIESRWLRFWQITACGIAGGFWLFFGLSNLLGMTEGRDEPRQASEARRFTGGGVTVGACFFFVMGIQSARCPCAVEVRPDGTIVIDRIYGRKTIPVRVIRAIDWKAKGQILTIKHGRRRTVLRQFTSATEFVSDVRRLHPTVVVTVTGSTGPGAST